MQPVTALYLGAFGLMMFLILGLRTHISLGLERFTKWFSQRSWTQNYQSSIQQSLLGLGKTQTQISQTFQTQSIVFGILVAGCLLISVLFESPWFLLLVIVAPFTYAHDLKNKKTKRNVQMAKTFPYFLDLFVLCLESGMDNMRSIREIASSQPQDPLYQELLWVMQATQVGQTLQSALLKAAQRTQSEELYFLAHSVAQSAELGSSLSSILRTQSGTLREKLFQHAQEQAQKAPVKILYPLILCIFPVIFILLFVPLALSLFATF